MKNFDIVIPVGPKDVFGIKQTLKFIHQFIHAQHIYIIASQKVIHILSKWYKLKDVIFIDENNLIKGLTYKNIEQKIKEIFNPHYSGGWYFQQFIKMGFAISTYAKEYYLIWDADTIPLSEITFFENENILFNPKKEFHPQYFRTIKNLLGLERKVTYSFISEHLMIKTSIMKNLIDDINKSKAPGNIWYDKILNQIEPDSFQCFSEFETYGTFCSYYYPTLYKERKLNSFRNCAKYCGPRLIAKDIKALQMDFDIVSLELFSMKDSWRYKHIYLFRKILAHYLK